MILLREIDEFLRHTIRQDFQASSIFLQSLFQNDMIEEFSSTLKEVIEETKSPTLSVRNHITYFFSMIPIYFALHIPSYEILLIPLKEDNTEDFQSTIVQFTLASIRNDDGNISITDLDVSITSKTEYAIIIPDIISKRMIQIENCKIFYYEEPIRERTLYCISHLSKTSFGRRILLALDIPPSKIIITNKDWKRISKALIELKLNPSLMLVKLDREDWFEVIDNESIRSKNNSTEIQLLEKVAYCTSLLESPSDSVRMQALKRLSAIDCIGHIEIIKKIIATAEKKEQAKALEILSSSGLPGNIEYLSDLVRKTDGQLRTDAAKALSRLTSRIFTKSIDALASSSEHQVRVGVTSPSKHGKTSLIRLENLAHHSNPLVRLEVAKSLAPMAGERVKHILEELLHGSGRIIRLELARLIPIMSEENARITLDILYRFKDQEILEVTRDMAEKRWGMNEGLGG